MEIKKKSNAEIFVDWVARQPMYVGIFFIPALLLIYVVALGINKIKGVS